MPVLATVTPTSRPPPESPPIHKFHLSHGHKNSHHLHNLACLTQPSSPNTACCCPQPQLRSQQAHPSVCPRTPPVQLPAIMPGRHRIPADLLLCSVSTIQSHTQASPTTRKVHKSTPPPPPLLLTIYLSSIQHLHSPQDPIASPPGVKQTPHTTSFITHGQPQYPRIITIPDHPCSTQNLCCAHAPMQNATYTSPTVSPTAMSVIALTCFTQPPPQHSAACHTTVGSKFLINSAPNSQIPPRPSNHLQQAHRPPPMLLRNHSTQMTETAQSMLLLSDIHSGHSHSPGVRTPAINHPPPVQNHPVPRP